MKKNEETVPSCECGSVSIYWSVWGCSDSTVICPSMPLIRGPGSVYLHYARASLAD